MFPRTRHSVAAWLPISIGLLGASLYFAPVAVSQESVEAESQLLLQSKGPRGYGHGVPRDDPYLIAIRSLESKGSAEAITVLLEFVKTPEKRSELKLFAVAALGTMGSRNAVSAIRDLEAWAAARHPVSFESIAGVLNVHTRSYGGTGYSLVASAKDSVDTEWKLLQGSRFGYMDLYLATEDSNKGIIRPLLIDTPIRMNMGAFYRMKGNGRIGLNCLPDEDEFVLSLGNDEIRFSLASLIQDTDSDGLPDIGELRLGTDPYDADTDGDGKEDGKDSNPFLGPGTADTEDGQIRQTVFAFFAGTTAGTYPIKVYRKGDGGNQEYYGYSGIVMHTGVREFAGRNLTMSITSQTPQTATVRPKGTIGGIGTGSYIVELRKAGGPDGKWVVTSFKRHGLR